MKYLSLGLITLGALLMINNENTVLNNLGGLVAVIGGYVCGSIKR